MKDLKFVEGWAGSDTTELTVFYGDAKLDSHVFYDDDVDAVKNLMLSLQLELAKETLRAPTNIINNLTVAPTSPAIVVPPPHPPTVIGDADRFN